METSAPVWAETANSESENTQCLFKGTHIFWFGIKTLDTMFMIAFQGVICQWAMEDEQLEPGEVLGWACVGF